MLNVECEDVEERVEGTDGGEVERKTDVEVGSRLWSLRWRWNGSGRAG